MENKIVYVGCDKRICAITDSVPGLNPFTFENDFGIRILSVNENDITKDVRNDIFNHRVDLDMFFETRELKFYKARTASTNIKMILTNQETVVKTLRRFLLHTLQYITPFNTSFASGYVDMYILQEIQEYKQTQKIGMFLEKLLEEESKFGYNLDDIIEKYLMKSEDRKRTLVELYSQEVNVIKLLKENKFDEAIDYVSSVIRKSI
jgi:hypothetical protein